MIRRVCLWFAQRAYTSAETCHDEPAMKRWQRRMERLGGWA